MPSLIMDLDLHAREITTDGVADYYWPVSPSEVNALYPLIVEKIINKIQTASQEQVAGTDIAIILSFAFAIEVVTTYYSYLIVKRARLAGREIIPSKRHRLITAILNGEKPKRSIILKRLEEGPEPLKRLRAPLRWVRDVMMSHREGMKRYSFKSSDYQKKIISITIDDIAKVRAKTAKEPVVYRRLNEWFSSTPIQITEPNPVFRSLIDALLAGVNEIIGPRDQDLMIPISTYLLDWLQQGFTLVAKRQEELRKNPKKIPHRLWLDTSGNIWGRILAREVKKRGGETTRHDHGSGCGYFEGTLAQGGHDFEDCDQYVTFSSYQALVFSKHYDPRFVVQNNKPKFSHIISSDLFKNKIKKLNNDVNTIKEIQTVMYVGTVHTAEQIFPLADAFMSGVTLLDWECRLLNQLSMRYNRIIVKPHPESLLPNRLLALLKEKNITISKEPFEHVVHLPEVLLLDDPTSTVFSTILTTNKPFVFIDFGIQQFSEEARQLLMLRCPIVRGWFDENHRATINWQDLHQAIKDSPRYQDRGFYNKYYNEIN